MDASSDAVPRRGPPIASFYSLQARMAEPEPPPRIRADRASANPGGQLRHAPDADVKCPRHPGKFVDEVMQRASRFACASAVWIRGLASATSPWCCYVPKSVLAPR